MQLALVLSILAPAVVVAVLIGVGVLLGRARQGAGEWALALAVPLAALAAYVPVRGLPRLPPADAGIWPLWCGLAAAVVEIVVQGLSLGRTARWLVRFVAAAATIGLVCRPLIENSWTSTDTGIVVCISLGLVMAVSIVVERQATRMAGFAMPLALAGLAAGVAAILGASGTALLAQTAAGAAVAFGVMLLFSVLRPTLPVSAAAGPAAVMLGGFLLAGRNYAEVGLASIALIVVAALAIGLWPMPAGQSRPGTRTVLSVGAVAFVLTAAAVTTALRPDLDPTHPSADEASSDDDDDYDGYD